MAMVNFSVPDEVKQAFNQTFSKENKSAIMANLMRRAVEEREAHQRRCKAIDKILALRTNQPVSCTEFAKASKAIR